MANLRKIITGSLMVAGFWGLVYFGGRDIKDKIDLTSGKYETIAEYNQMVKTLELIRYDPHPTATAYYAHIKNQMLVVRQSQNFSKLCNEYTKKEQRHLPSVVGALASVLLASVLTVIPAVAEADKKRKPLKP